MKDLDNAWNQIIKKIEKQFKGEISLKGVLYLIGVQELNLGCTTFKREEKINVLHVATCKLLSRYGYYRFDRIDSDGWPHYVELKALKSLSEKDQEMLIKRAIIEYLS